MRSDFAACFIIGFLWGNACMGLVLIASILW